MMKKTAAMKAILRVMSRLTRRFVVLAGLSTLYAAEPAGENKVDPAVESKADPAALLKAIQLPGLEINLADHSVDIEAVVCLDRGSLELIACTRGTKEHESICVVEALPVHIHTALLLLGAKNGNPAMRRPVNEEQTRWVDVPPQGDPIDVFLAWKDEKGNPIERPIGDFLERSESAGGDPAELEEKEKKEKKEKFPGTFLFAGSLLGDPDEKPRTYLAQSSGNVISISTFGDEVLCLPDVHSQENGALAWQVDPTHLPKVQSKVTLRLRVKKPAP
jgi:hypothetical protein